MCGSEYYVTFTHIILAVQLFVSLFIFSFLMWNKSRNQLFGVKWNVGFIWFAQFLIIYIKSRPSQQWNLAPTLAKICRESKDPNYRMSRTAIYLISASVKQSCWELLRNPINDNWRPSHTYTGIKIYQKDFFLNFFTGTKVYFMHTPKEYLFH